MQPIASRYQAWIFDFDYTLGNSEEGIVLSAAYALQQMGCPAVERDAIRRTIGTTLRDSYTALTGDSDAAARDRYAALFMQHADEVMTAHSHLYPSVLALLRALRERDVRIGIVTTKHRRRILAILDKYDACELPHLIVGGDDVKVEKPSPEGLLYAAERLADRPEQVLYVGDSVVDAKTAAAAGIDFCAVLTGTTPAEAFAPYHPLLVCPDVCALYVALYGQALHDTGAAKSD